MCELRRVGFFLSLSATLGLCACGGGGGSSAPPPPNPLYVSVRTGSDTNLGDRSHPLKSVAAAGRIALGSYKIFVGSGTYNQGVTPPTQGAAPDGVQYIADLSGTLTGDPPGSVVINASQDGFGFKMNSSKGTLIDGFTITGGADAGIVLKSGSNNFIIQDCIIHDNSGDGIRVQDSANVLIFNNLVYNSGGNGLRIAGDTLGSNQATLVNNTVYGSSGYGILIGTTSTASPAAFVRNNILQNNARSSSTDANIKVTSTATARSEVNYQGDYNLVYAPDKYFGPQGIKGANDINANARLVNPGSPDGFYLQSISPAIDHGGTLNNLMTQRVRLTDLATETVFLADFLRGRRTTLGATDTGPLDIGYHYP